MTFIVIFLQIRQLPESVIVDTTEYKCLQSQFSVLYNESMQIKTMLDETRNQLQSSKNQHLRQIEMMESEELIAQKKVRSEMIQMEDVLAQIRKEYEMLRIEFEQNMAANEQTAPINREMRHLITSLQNHNGQLKGDVLRYKRKYKDTAVEMLKLRKEFEEATAKLNGAAEAKKADLARQMQQESGGSAGGAGGSSGGGGGQATLSSGGSAISSGGGALGNVSCGGMMKDEMGDGSCAVAMKDESNTVGGDNVKGKWWQIFLWIHWFYLYIYM